MSSLVVIDRSPDPERTDPGRARGPTIASWVRAMGPNRTGALLLVAGTLLAVLWANGSHGTYEAFWDTHLTIGVADLNLDFTLHALVNDALMAVFFFTVGLEVRREFAIGELTSRSRAVVPVVAAVCGLLVPSLLYVLIARDTGWANAWGVVISTDTAFLVGGLALVGPRAAGRLRIFLLALAVVDDIGALTVIALVYTGDFTPQPLLVAAAGLAGIWFTRYVPTGRGPIYATLAIIVWFAFLASGVHPTLAGVAVALLVPVYRPSRRDVEHALRLARTFRQSPTTQYARAAANSLRESISINERLQSAYAPYVSFVILPVFALANAGVQISGDVLTAAATSAVTWGIVVALVVGKFVGVFGSTMLVRAFGVGELGPGLTPGRVAGGAALCGVGFTLSLFIVDLAISDPAVQNQARVGVLLASVLAFGIAAIVFRVTERSPREAEVGQVLQRPVDPERDHVFGPADAPLTLVEYGDFQCGFCLKTAGTIQEVVRELGGSLRYVWRHAPLLRYHPNAVAAAEASEAAALQGKFFEFERALFADQEHQQPTDILERADRLGLDLEKFEKDLTSPAVAARVRDDMLDAEAMDITAVPTLFVNGRRHTAPHDAQSLIHALLRTGRADDAPAPGGGRRSGPGGRKDPGRASA
ncbi:Na+/H+ antiporter NhaA [Myceligenerans indicum]|uniref:Na(+)/H(+) antiporter NhaA n=1 Tax=Myceligenerans indicum TaxID=2593663 RepID=A0ABS1LPT4_9MICO|nr:Na+/H+ antiporter NhaA [Myceligenerans indicum]MBL0888225.1 Na+/H+ antiporter NhaA [Myceligenerans indicum]